MTCKIVFLYSWVFITHISKSLKYIWTDSVAYSSLWCCHAVCPGPDHSEMAVWLQSIGMAGRQNEGVYTPLWCWCRICLWERIQTSQLCICSMYCHYSWFIIYIMHLLYGDKMFSSVHHCIFAVTLALMLIIKSVITNQYGLIWNRLCLQQFSSAL